MWYIIDALLWIGTGAVGAVVYFKATHSCVNAIIGTTCIEHPFNLMSAFGM